MWAWVLFFILLTITFISYSYYGAKCKQCEPFRKFVTSDWKP